MIRNRKVPNSNFDNQSLLLDEKRAAELLGVSLSSLRKSRCEGQHGLRTAMPPFVRLGGRVLYKRSDLETWVQSLASYNHIGEEAAR
jgi:predicted DNA-binding transcriptional regulator AlpA